MPYSTHQLRDTCARAADSFLPHPEKASATEIRYTKLKEKHSELINTHAELLRKVMLMPAPAGSQPLPLFLCHHQCGLCLPSPTLYWSHHVAPRELWALGRGHPLNDGPLMVSVLDAVKRHL